MEDPTYGVEVTGQPEYKSELFIDNKCFSIRYITPKPNIWFRFWYKVLLNWQWEDIDGQ